MDRLASPRSVLSFLIAGTLACSYAFGGIVEFNPTNQNIDPTGDTIATFEVTVIPEVQGGVDTADIVIGSRDGLRIVDFAFSEEWCSMWVLCFLIPPDPGPSDDVYISSNSPHLLDFDSILLGTVRADAAELADGVYTFGVDANWDGFSCLGQLGEPVDPLFGSATVTVPEPSMIVLLALASLAFTRRHLQRSSKACPC